MDRKNDPGPPPERFARLFPGAGITSPEALMRAFRISSGQGAPEKGVCLRRRDGRSGASGSAFR